jgi:hypothetical protein
VSAPRCSAEAPSAAATVVAWRHRRTPRYLRALADYTREFGEALIRFLDLCEGTNRQSDDSLPAVVVRDDVNPATATSAMQAVSLAAGRIVDVLSITGAKTTWSKTSGPIDPFGDWLTITRSNSQLEPQQILDICNQATGRLEALIARAEAEAPIQADVEAMHPLVWGAARGLWRSGHFREAVAAAAGALIEQAKSLTGRNDVSETSLWQETFSENAPQPNKPRLRWPGDPNDQTVKSMNAGLRSFSPGIQLTIRNPAVHRQVELTAQEATERLAAISLLARWLEACERIEAPPTNP